MTSMIMDSPALQSQASVHHLPPATIATAHTTANLTSSPSASSTPRQPARSHNNSFSHPVNPRGSIQKRHHSSATIDRHRSISISNADRLYRLAAEQQGIAQSDLQQRHDSIQSAALGVQWITPQHSPQLSGFAPEPSIEPFPQWTAPTPPRSDSGIPNVSIDSDEPVAARLSGAQEYAFEPQSTSADMSSLGFLLPTQYGASPYDSESSNYQMEQNYIPPMRMSQPPSSSGASAYAATASSSPALYQSRVASDPRRSSEMPPTSTSAPSYARDYRQTSNPYDAAGYSVAPSQTIPSISGLTHSPLPSPHMSSTSQAPHYTTRSPSMYPDHSIYSQPPHSQPGPYSSAPPTSAQMYSSAPPSQQYPQHSPQQQHSQPSALTDSSIRVLDQRPKPQCWEHGCNGRQFSTFSNLLRHQREKSGTAAKSYCPKCGAEFTRTTARNGHLAHDKCTKARRGEEGK